MCLYYVCLIEAVEGGNGSVAHLGDSVFCFLECSTLFAASLWRIMGCGAQDSRQWVNSLAAPLSSTADTLP